MQFRTKSHLQPGLLSSINAGIKHQLPQLLISLVSQYILEIIPPDSCGVQCDHCSTKYIVPQKNVSKNVLSNLL